jgi:hypothetical protein
MEENGKRQGKEISLRDLARAVLKNPSGPDSVALPVALAALCLGIAVYELCALIF